MYADLLKVLFGSVVSIGAAFVLLTVENRKQVQIRRHEFAVKELGEKVFSPLLNQLSEYETKKQLHREARLDLSVIILAISRNQFQLLFTTERVKSLIQSIYRAATSTTQSASATVLTQDEYIIGCIRELQAELQRVYSRYRM